MDKKKLLTKVINDINDKRGPGGSAIGFARDVAKPLTFLPLSSEALNNMLGGGIARGRITEIFGNNSSGKTSVMIEAIGEDMERDPDSYWVWLESENSFDIEYAKDVHNIDPDRLIFINVDDLGAEKSIDKAEVFMRSGAITGLVVNSVAGLTPEKEMKEELEKANIALQARMMSKLMRKWTALIGKHDIVAVFINQLRTDIGKSFGDPNVTTGGRALAFYSTQRFGMNTLKIQDSDPITSEDGMKISCRIAKNRAVYDNPYKKCEYFVIYGEGVDKMTEIMENVGPAGIMRTSGSWFYYEKEDGELLKAEKAIVKGKEEKDVDLRFNGKSNFRKFMQDNPWFFDQLHAELRGKVKQGELIPTFQDEKELQEIEKLNEIEKQIAAEEEKKAKQKPKADPDAKAPVKKAPTRKKKAVTKE